MENLINAIKSGDLVEAKREFNAKMALVKESVYANEKVSIARSVIVEGEEPKDKDDGDEDEDDEDEDELDEAARRPSKIKQAYDLGVSLAKAGKPRPNAPEIMNAYGIKGYDSFDKGWKDGSKA